MSVNLGENKIADVFKFEQGSAGGTNDYNELDNKPQINGVTLQGNKTSADLGIVTGPTDVYTKQETNTLVDTKIAEAGATKADTSYVNEQLNLKADKSAVDLALASKANVDDVYTKEETTSAINSAITGKADTSYVNEQLNLKADKVTTYTKEEVNTAISDLQASVNTKLNTKADKTDTYTKSETVQAIKDNTTNKADTSYVNEQLNLKADKSNTYTKEEVDDMFDNPTITGDTLPVGSVVEWTGTQTPQNWLLCDGREVSRTTYSELFAAIGTVWGAGDGSTSFNIPDYRDKFVLGAGRDVDLAETGGEKTHKLTVNEIPPHSHRYSEPVSTQSVTTGNYAIKNWIEHAQTGSTGGGQPHNNMPPYVGSYYIIKAKQSAGVVATVVDNLSSTSPTDALSANQGKILNDKTVTFEKTTNGFNLKFANGFMIQKKILTRTTVNCNQRANPDDTLLYYGTKNMGKWDVPFTELFDFTYTIGTIYGERMPWLASNTWNKSASKENKATTTACGIVNMYLNWSAQVTCDLTCTGFGMWK